ncbi:MFS transporter [Streptomyces sp. TLI_185]|uniref:MFS transporter n=1 Tax=Streptomyces sp. TLI_185 TaxID=2485151 RepID=UPI000F5064CF|nr:MFS transporter [Streptomyces sp. TLI_185]
MPRWSGKLAEPDRRGRVVGTVASGVLIGVPLSRTASGFVADHLGWRAIHVITAAASLVLAVVLRTVILPLEPREPVPYLRLLGSVFTTVARRRGYDTLALADACAGAVAGLTGRTVIGEAAYNGVCGSGSVVVFPVRPDGEHDDRPSPMIDTAPRPRGGYCERSSR